MTGTKELDRMESLSTEHTDEPTDCCKVDGKDEDLTESTECSDFTDSMDRSERMGRTVSMGRMERMSHMDSSSRMASFMMAASLRSLRPLGTDKKTLDRSLWAVRIGLLADAMSTMILWPNYAFMASPGATDSSFESTNPFEFNGATYFLSLAPLFSTAIMSCLMGNISDRFGRRPSMLLCVGVSVFLTVGKYIVRDSFWGFSAASCVNGILAGTLPGACQ